MSGGGRIPLDRRLPCAGVLDFPCGESTPAWETVTLEQPLPKGEVPCPPPRRAGGGARKLRVVHVTLGLEVGGQENLLVEFARHADRVRFGLHFVSLTGRGALASDIEACGWPVTALGAP